MAAGLVLVAGCTDRPSPAFEERGRAVREEVTLEVMSNQYLDVVVYMGEPGAWHRAGDVTGLGSATLRMPSIVGPLPGSYWIRAHGIGSPDGADYLAGPVNLGPGDVIELRLASVLRMSSWSLRSLR